MSNDFLNQAIELRVSVGVSRTVLPTDIRNAIYEAIKQIIESAPRNTGFPLQKTMVEITSIRPTGY